jgi:NAD(P)-dependent dehydrogenase (short-subunit alcohol dehydrogenase family)
MGQHRSGGHPARVVPLPCNAGQVEGDEGASVLLEDKVAIVTGGGSGIGRATALRMAREGARVVIADIAPDAGQAVADEVTAAGGEALAHVTDVAEESSIHDLIRSACDAFGGVDVMFNNAAAVGPDEVGRDVDLLNLDVDVWDRTMAVNVRGVMLGCKHVIPVMIERGGGAIVNTTSTAGLAGADIRYAYGTSKSALIAFAKYVATGFGKHGIRCNNVAPSLTVTPSVGRMIPENKLDLFLKVHLVGRLGQPDDIANAVVWLASEQASFVTGHTLLVEGGLLAHTPTFPWFNE